MGDGWGETLRDLGYGRLAMPTLIRLAVALLVLAALALGAMVALAVFVDPGRKEIRVRIPASELGGQETTADPLGIRTPATEPVATPAAPAAPAASTAPQEPALSEPDGGGTRTVELPAE